jgi:hypothetical protein
MTVRCWAQSLGDCSSIQSREHYVTKGLFPGNSIKVQGLPWCKVDEKTVGLASASSKILCQEHNARLSPLDDEAIKLFQALGDIFLLQNIQRNLRSQAWKVRQWKANGRLLERWFLKTFINLVQVQENEFRWPDSDVPRAPSREAVAACFGRLPIRSPRGLYAAAALGHDINSYDYVNFMSINDATVNALAGGTFEFRGLRFVFAWTDRDLEPFIRQLANSLPQFSGWHDANLMHPFRGLNFDVSGYRAQVLRIVWPPFRPQE